MSEQNLKLEYYDEMDKDFERTLYLHSYNVENLSDFKVTDNKEISIRLRYPFIESVVLNEYSEDGFTLNKIIECLKRYLKEQLQRYEYDIEIDKMKKEKNGTYTFFNSDTIIASGVNLAENLYDITFFKDLILGEIKFENGEYIADIID